MTRFSPQYTRYMQSPEWDDLRRFMLHKVGYVCERCGRGNKPLDVHHLTYERLGHESIEDLMVLCQPCHRWVHFWKRARKWLVRLLTAR